MEERVEVADEESFLKALELVDEGPVSFSSKWRYIGLITDPDVLAAEMIECARRGLSCVVERVTLPLTKVTVR